MAIPGPKPKPAALRLAASDGKTEPGAAPGPVRIPAPPAWLRPEAKAEWKRLAKRLANKGLLASIDTAAFAAYCQAFGNWAAAEKELARLRRAESDELAGFVAKTAAGNLIHHPLGTVAQKARLETVKLAAEFGLTPSSRARLDSDAAKNRGGDDPADEFFN